MTDDADRLEERLAEMFSKAPLPASDQDLDPLLAMAKRLHQIGAIAPSAAAVQRTRLALARASVPQARPSPGWWPKLATATPLAIALMVGATIAGFAAPSALPDSPLYAVRNLRESVEITLAATPGQRSSLYITFAQQRAEQLVGVARGKTASPAVISTLLRDISSRIHAADADTHGGGAAAQATIQHAEGLIETELTQLHQSDTLSPDANRQLDNTIHDVQSSESTNAAGSAPAPDATVTPEAPSGAATGTTPDATATPEPTPTAEMTSTPIPTTGSSSNETP